jgi:hypothetical protein
MQANGLYRPKTQYQRLKAEIDAGIQRVLDHGQYIIGPEVAELEEKLAAYTGSKHCITVANGTDALQIAQMAIGIGPGDEVRIQIWGSVDFAGSQTLDRNGQINLPKIGAISLGGVQVKDLEAVLKKASGHCVQECERECGPWQAAWYHGVCGGSRPPARHLQLEQPEHLDQCGVCKRRP